MPFKSERSCSSISTNLAFKVVAGILFLAASESAWATWTIQSIKLDGTQLSNVASDIAYFTAVTTRGATYPGIVDTGASDIPVTLDLTQTQEQDIGFSNLVVFQINSDKEISVSGSQQVVVTVNAVGQGGSNSKPIPIAYFNSSGVGQGSVCDDTRCQGRRTDVNNLTYYTAVKYTPKSTIQVGVYPSDICAFYSATNQGAQANGCSGSVVNPGSTPPIQLVFTLGIAENGNAETPATSVPSGSTVGVDDKTIGVAFESGEPSLVCSSGLNDIYYPGDKQILLNSQGFGLSTSVASSGGTASPPPQTLIVVGKDGGEPDISSTFNSGTNSFVERVALGSPQEPVSIPQNTTNGTDYTYNVAFMVRDLSGAVAAPATWQACGIAGVQSSAIQGFLQKSSCFIATAAYRDADAAPVVMLREFRDRILLQSSAGRAFVRWYYAWSPGAAEWLMEHSVFRYPVLIALIPVEVIAWLCLHPAWLAALLGLNLCALAALRLRKREAR